MATRKTMVGKIDDRVLAFTAGSDTTLDLVLAEADCIGTAAHVTMLSRIKGKKRILTARERDRVVSELVAILRDIRKGTFRIRPKDQDIHLAVERRLTRVLGDVGRKVHTARSRNDQVAVDLRLYAKEALLAMMAEASALASALLGVASRNAMVPMVGRTHFQPAMPSSVGLWAGAHAESLLDDLVLLRSAYDFNDRSPLGSAAGYGVALDIDRASTARMLGFREPITNVLYAGNARGKCESVILSAVSQVMLTLSRLSEDLVLFCSPEFGYFTFPPEFGTGSSIMPQKNNPDVLELVRARSFKVLSASAAVHGIVAALPSGYNRDLQETKEPFLQGVATGCECLAVLVPLITHLGVNEGALRRAFTPAVFATDEALRRVVSGVPFRQAYDDVKRGLTELRDGDPGAAAVDRFGPGGPADAGVEVLASQAATAAREIVAMKQEFHGQIAQLLGVNYPDLA